MRLGAMRAVRALAAAGAVAMAGPVLAGFGDVAPRAEPDGQVTAADMVQALRWLRHDDEPGTFELMALDVAPGLDEPALVTPPAFLPGGDATLDAADLTRLRDDLLSRARLPSSPGILLRDGRRVVVAGIPWRDRALLVSPFLSRATFALDAVVPGLTLDAATGDLELLATDAQAGALAFGLTAHQPERDRRARVALSVVVPRSLARHSVSPAGTTLTVSDPAGELDGTDVEIPFAELQSTARVSLAVSALDEGAGGGPPLTGALIVALPAGEDAWFHVALPVTPALIARAGGEDRLTWEALVPPLAACDSGVESPGRITAWPQWVRLPSAVSGGRLRATAFTGCPGEAVLRVAVAPLPPSGCLAPADTARVHVEAAACPAPNTFTLEQVRDLFDAAITQWLGAGYDVPGLVTVIVDDLPLGRDAFIDPSVPATVRIARTLSADELAVVAAHETFHVAQAEAMDVACAARVDSWRRSAFLLEGSASWAERALLTGPDAPEPARLFPSRRLPSLTRRPLDALAHEAWPLFDWLETTHGIAPAGVFQAFPMPDLASEGGGLIALDAAITRGGAGSLDAAWPAFMQPMNVTRDAASISAIEALALPDPPVTLLSSDATESAPAVRCDVVLPHASGTTWLLDVPRDLPVESGLVLRIDGTAPLSGHLVLADDGTLVREIPPGAPVALGALRGRLALHVHDPRLAEDGDVPVADLSAWVTPVLLPEADSDGDGIPDEAEEDAGSDPFNPSSQPAETWASAPPVLVALTAPAAEGQPEFEAVVAAPPVLVALAGPVTEGQAQFETVVAAPPVLVGRTGPVTEGQKQFETVVAAPPVTVGRTGPVAEGQKQFESVVAAPPVSVTQESP